MRPNLQCPQPLPRNKPRAIDPARRGHFSDHVVSTNWYAPCIPPGMHQVALEQKQQSKHAAKSAQLTYVSDDKPGISRHRHGAGFQYTLPSGSTVRDRETLARIKSLAIPPAWTDVWICPDENGHIQAVGRDPRGRK